MHKSLRNRDIYLRQLKAFQDTEMIKVITGIRRCGKSCLMKLMVEHLRGSGIGDKQIVEMNFESMRFAVMTAKDLYRYVSERVIPGKRMYLFFDEVQRLDGWENAVNSFRVDFDCDTVQIDCLPDMNLVLRLGQKKEQKFQNQSTAQPAAFDFEIGKAHGEVNVPNVLGADKARIGHGFGEPIALIAAGGGTMVIFAAFSQILAADILIAFLSVSAVEPTAFIAQKFHLVLLGICQGVQFFKVLVQAKIRHNIAEIGAPGYPCQRQQVGQDDNFRIQR